MKSKKSCRHRRFKDGPRTPLRWGSAATQVCEDCGAWREDERNGEWSRWRLARLLPARLEDNES